MKKEKKNFGMRPFMLSAFIFSVLFSTAQQNDSLPQKELKPLVVSASRMEKDPDSLGRSISVITADELKNNLFNSMADVLSSQEGIYVVGTEQNPGMAQSIFMRGANSNQTVVLVDGIRLTDPSSTNNALNITELSTANIDRIEIIRGSHSTMYGSSAIGGVINIITKKSSKPGFIGNAELKTGTFGKGTMALSENFFGSYTFKNGLYTNFEFMGMNTNGMDATVDTSTVPAFKKKDKDDFSSLELNGKIGFRKNKIDAFFAIKDMGQVSDLDKAAYVDDDNYYLNFRRQLFSYGIDYKFSEKFKLSFEGGYTRMKRYAEDDSSIVDTMYVDSIGHVDIYDQTYYDDLYEGSSLTNELQLNYTSKKIDAVFGGGMLDEKMSSENYFYSKSMWGVYETSSNLDSLGIDVLTASIFFHMDAKGSLLTDKLRKLTLSAGGRFANHSMFGNSYTYEVNPSWRASDKSLLYVSYSTNFNAPSMYQLYAPFLGAASDITRGNKNLKAETGKGFEGGVKFFPSEGITISACYFYSKVKNSIEYVYLWNRTTPVDSIGFYDYLGDTYLNIGTQYTQGVELGFTTDLSEKFTLGGHISLLDGKILYAPESIDTLKTEGNHVQLYNNGAFLNDKEVSVLGLTRRPDCASLFAGYKISKLVSVRLDMRYAGSQYDVYYNSELGPFGALGTIGLEDYALMDISLKVALKNLIIIAKAENVFDKRYSEIYGFTTRGRGLYLSLKYAI